MLRWTKTDSDSTVLFNISISRHVFLLVFIHVALPGLLLMSTLGERGAGRGSMLSSRALAAVECWAFLMLVPSASHTCSPRVSCTVKICRRDRCSTNGDAFTFLTALWQAQMKKQKNKKHTHLGMCWPSLAEELILWLEPIETG